MKENSDRSTLDLELHIFPLAGNSDKGKAPVISR